MSDGVRLTGSSHTVIPHLSRIVPSQLSIRHIFVAYVTTVACLFLTHLSVVASSHHVFGCPCSAIQVTPYRGIFLDPNMTTPPNMIIFNTWNFP